MRSSRERVARIARLQIAAVRGAGDLRGVECHWQYMPRINRLIAGKVSGVMAVWASVARKRSNDVRHQRRAPPSAVLAGVESFAAQRVRRLDQERFCFEVHPTAGAGACVACRGHVNLA